jgi:GDP-4-dehydro-6-deoxy-D-mannose reductase
MASKKVFITGFTGQVGSQLADYILENTDYQVVGAMRWQEDLSNIEHLSGRINNNDRISIAYFDLNDFSSVYRVLNESRPDFISHLAAQSFPKTSFNTPLETLQTNIMGTANLLESVRQLSENFDYRPVVHVCSSSEVYGKTKPDTTILEDTQFHGSSPYSVSKIGADFLGRFYGEAYGLRTFVTRMGTHSGPRRSDVFFESTIAKQIALIEAGLQPPVLKIGNLNSTRTFQDARDAVRAYFLLMEKSADGGIRPGEYFNIAGDEHFELSKVVDLLLSMSTRRDIEVMVDEDRLRPIDADYQMFDNSKIREAIDWKPQISAEEMFRDLLTHWREHIASGRIPLGR